MCKSFGKKNSEEKPFYFRIYSRGDMKLPREFQNKKTHPLWNKRNDSFFGSKSFRLRHILRANEKSDFRMMRIPVHII